jgi:hypothetical protein
MSYPADWFVGEKEGEWKHGQPLYADTPGRDLFGSVKANYHVNVAAEALSAPTTPDEWEAMVVADMQLPSSCGDPKTIEKTTLGGEPALKLTFSCSGDDVDIIFILAVHGQKGFAVAWDSPYGDEAADQELFGRFLSGFAFTG